MDRTEILILAHGSRDEPANVEFESLVEAYRRAHPEFEVSHGYIELATPSFQEALAQAAQRSRRVVVLPLFLFRAGHSGVEDAASLSSFFLFGSRLTTATIETWYFLRSFSSARSFLLSFSSLR